MGAYNIHLFREFEATCGDHVIDSLGSKKACELFCYLLINRGRPFTRERLSGLLWPETSETQAKQYLRQTLWQLQSALDEASDAHDCLLSVESEWISIDLSEQVWLDVGQFEQAYRETQGGNGRLPDAHQVAQLETAVALYRGDLLENWYQDWCVFERERLQNMYLSMLDKLAGYYEATINFQAGLDCATALLRLDIAHERTYRRLMRLYYYAGDRSSALRQYQRCEKVLEQELDVKPSQQTLQLLEQIKQDELPVTGPTTVDLAAPDRAAADAMLAGLSLLNEQLSQSQRHLSQEIDAMRAAMADLLHTQ
ncbi:MAG: BTAD domain-containing putative transcriptional regulator [Candidatus Promineifilaceae bacterium]